MSLCSVHLAAMSMEYYRTDSLFLWHISNSVLSSTCLYNGAGVSRSFIYTRKHFGPSNVPYGTSPFGCPGGEKSVSYVNFLGSIQQESCNPPSNMSHTVLILQVVYYG